VETIKWQTRDACGYLAVRLQACVCGLSLQPIGCTSILSVMYSTAAAAVVASGAISLCLHHAILGMIFIGYIAKKNSVKTLHGRVSKNDMTFVVINSH